MSVNQPCEGCWNFEGGKCFEDKLAHVQDLEKVPRVFLDFEKSGLNITDELITACVEKSLRKSAAVVKHKIKKSFERALHI